MKIKRKCMRRHRSLPVVDDGSTARCLHAAACYVKQMLSLLVVKLATRISEAAATTSIFAEECVKTLLVATHVHDALLETARRVP